jgi:hypothetical protein
MGISGRSFFQPEMKLKNSSFMVISHAFAKKL